MTNRRLPQNTVYPPEQWNGGVQQYPNTSNTYTTPVYQRMTGHTSSTVGGHTGYASGAADVGYHSGYFSFSPAYPQNTVGSPPSHSPGANHVKHPVQQTDNHRSPPPPHSNAGYPYLPSHPPTSPHTHQRSRSHPNAQPPPHMFSPPKHTGHYPQQVVPISQTNHLPTQYPASPARPFSCDMCALSFNRQHDLKRHRETHTGDKPYFCNGGCGKTFTRKDALKRHQLVKNCGKVEESWP
ncbi:hypothetical protein BDN72DRAFT_768928 [Pluteus cervinus]|uniref:Uncharacterized protein n=1 Tax=Pluteus cervinus TaxID=181527 RepID=A0ACD3AS74_9AGAR|nr:hypothetical protein BDN72DRAFT_768928 [Pluteus cervinus]